MDRIMELARHTAGNNQPVVVPAAVASGGDRAETFAEVLATLYKKQLIDHNTLSRAVLKLRLDLNLVAKYLGISGNELVKELVGSVGFPEEAEDEVSNEPRWQTWEFEEAYTALFDPRTPKELSVVLNRTPDSIRSFRYRMRSLGCRINLAVWELFSEGYTPEQIASLGYPLWMPKFVDLVRKLQKSAVLLGHEPIKVIFT